MQRVTRPDVEGEAIGRAPVVFDEVFLDVVAGAKPCRLKIDLEGVDLTEKDAGDGVAAGDPLLVRTSGC